MDNSKVIFNMAAVPVPMDLYRFFGSFNKALVVQQIHYWCEVSKDKELPNKYHDGHYWMYNTYDDLADQLNMSVATIKRVIKQLEDEGYVVSSNYNKRGYDRTKWYRIDYNKLKSDLKANDGVIVSPRHYASAHDDTMDSITMTPPIPKSISKTNTKIINNKTYPFSTKRGLIYNHYHDTYNQYMDKPHAIVEPNEMEYLAAVLNTLIDDLGLTEDDVLRMIDYHFENLSIKNNGHIRAFIGVKDNSPLYRYQLYI